MYLTKTIYIGAYYEHRNVKIDITVTIDNQAVAINPNAISEITEQVKYWRKANHIHNWFVAHVQEGKDDCGTYSVSKEHFDKLLSDCEAVLKNKDKAEELLATKSGFFFGGTEYDEYYFQETQECAEVCRQVLTDVSKSGKYLANDYQYHASW